MKEANRKEKGQFYVGGGVGRQAKSDGSSCHERVRRTQMRKKVLRRVKPGKVGKKTRLEQIAGALLQLPLKVQGGLAPGTREY